MRLIDADKLKEEAYTSWECKSQPCAVVDVQEIDDAPTVDAVQVVRCKDCRWYDKVDWCNKLRISGVKAVEETWFCAGGERKDDE